MLISVYGKWLDQPQRNILKDTVMFQVILKAALRRSQGVGLYEKRVIINKAQSLMIIHSSTGQSLVYINEPNPRNIFHACFSL